MILLLYKNLIPDLADGRPEGFMNIVSGNSQDFTCLTQCEYLGCNLYIDGLSVGLPLGPIIHPSPWEDWPIGWAATRLQSVFKISKNNFNLIKIVNNLGNIIFM